MRTLALTVCLAACAPAARPVAVASPEDPRDVGLALATDDPAYFIAAAAGVAEAVDSDADRIARCDPAAALVSERAADIAAEAREGLARIGDDRTWIAQARAIRDDLVYASTALEAAHVEYCI